MAKIIKYNSQVLHRLTHQGLIQEEWEQEECKAECSSFMESLHQRLGPHSMVDDQKELSSKDVLQYDPYEDESQNAKCSPSWIDNHR